MASNSLIPGPAFVAGGTIAPFTVVKLSTTARQVLQTNNTADAPFGLAQEGQKGPPGVTGSDTVVAALVGDQIQVVGPGNVGKGKLGATVAAGDRVKNDANGAVITVPAGAGNYNVLGFALEGGAVNELIDIYVLPHRDTH